jgi:hypothetical protein
MFSEDVTDEDLLTYFAKMKAEHVGKSRPDVNKVLKNVKLMDTWDGI